LDTEVCVLRVRLPTGGITMADVLEGEVVEEGTGELQVVSGGALSELTRAEIDMQIATAKRYPRSLTQFKESAMEMACLDEETAASMFYVLPRDGKKIEGPSVRLAEVVGSAF